MNGFLDKLRNALLGTEYYEEGYEGDAYEDHSESAEREKDNDEHVSGFTRGTTKDRSVEINHIGTRKSAKNNNVISFQNAQSEMRGQLVITTPADVQDATVICEHIRDNKICVVNLEGVERANAQRIADFLGGAVFALSGEIERISNEIFVIAPASVHITAGLKEELKASGHVLSWASSFR